MNTPNTGRARQAMTNCFRRACAIAMLFLSLLLLVGCTGALAGESVAESPIRPDGSISFTMRSNVGKEIRGVVLESADGKPVADFTGGEIAEGEYEIVFTPRDFPAGLEAQEEFIQGELFDLTVTFADDTTYKLHGLNFKGMTEFTLLSAQEFYYLEYVNADGSTGSTLESEKAIAATAKAEAEAAAKAEAEEKDKAEAEAAAKAAKEKAAKEKAEQEKKEREEAERNYNYGYPSGGAGSVGQTEDECVDDLVLR